MNVKKLNEIFGYAHYIVGVLKILLLILAVIQIILNLNAISSGEYADVDYMPFSTTIGFAQLILAVGSIVMIILNTKEQPEVIPGYLLGLVPVVIELILPPIVLFFFIFVEYGMYMKAGNKIRNINISGNKSYKKVKQSVHDTDWFYEEK